MQSQEYFESFRQDLVKHLYKSKIVEEENLENLKNLKVGISGSYLIHNIIRYGNINIFHGFSKYQLSRYIKDLKDCFDSLGIKILVILQGIVYVGKNYRPEFQQTSKKVRETWQKILFDPEDADIPISLKDLAHYFFTETDILKILDDYEIEYIHAPYEAAAQLYFMTQFHFTHFACCGFEGLLVSSNSDSGALEYIVVDFDLTQKKFYYIETKKLKSSLGFKKEASQMHMFFLVNGYNPDVNTFIPIDYLDYLQNTHKDEDITKEFVFETVRAQIASHTTISKLSGSDDKNINVYHELRKKLESVLWFTSNCELNYKNDVTVAQRDTYYGNQLPNDVITFFVFGLIDRELIDSIANGHFVIKPPLSDSAEYHHHIDNFYKQMVQRITGIFTTKLSQKFKQGNYSLFRFYLPEPFVFTPREQKPSKFILRQNLIEKYEKENASHIKTKRIGFCKVLQYFAEYVRNTATPEVRAPTSNRKESLDFIVSTKLSPLTKVAKNNSEDNFESALNRGNESPEPQDKSPLAIDTNSEIPQSHEEILAYLYMSFLEVYQYLETQNQQNQTPVNPHLMVLGAALRKCDEAFEERLVMLLELMKPNLCLINGKEFNNSKPRKLSTEAPLNSSDKREHLDHQFYQINLWSPDLGDEEKELIILISRVFSLMNASIRPDFPESNFADYDYDLCQYLNILNHLQKTLRFNFEALLLNTYLSINPNPRKNAEVFFGLRKKLPFRNNLNISLGIAIKKLLQTKETLKEFEEKNPHFVNLEYDLKASYILWENVLFVQEYQKSKGEYSVELFELFKKANHFLTKRFKDLGLLEN